MSTRSGVAALMAALAVVCGIVARGVPVSDGSRSVVPGIEPASTSPEPSVVVSSSATSPGASALDTADRLGGPQPVTPCQQIAYDIGIDHVTVTQVIVVITPTSASTTADLQVARLTEKGWTCTAAMSARVGRSGVRPLLDRRSGDGTTPAGVFPLGVMTAWDGQVFSMFGNSPDPGVSAGPYRRVRTGDCFGATPNHPDYGHLVFRPAAECPGPDDEYLPKYTGTYEHAALIGANMEPDVSGDAPGEIPYAAAIFLHRHSYDSSGASKPTSGCVSLRHDDLVAVLRALRPGVVFAIGTKAWLLGGGWST